MISIKEFEPSVFCVASWRIRKFPSHINHNNGMGCINIVLNPLQCSVNLNNISSTKEFEPSVFCVASWRIRKFPSHLNHNNGMGCINIVLNPLHASSSALNPHPFKQVQVLLTIPKASFYILSMHLLSYSLPIEAFQNFLLLRHGISLL